MHLRELIRTTNIILCKKKKKKNNCGVTYSIIKMYGGSKDVCALIELCSKPAGLWPRALMSPAGCVLVWPGWCLPLCPPELWLPLDTCWMLRFTVQSKMNPQSNCCVSLIIFILPTQENGDSCKICGAHKADLPGWEKLNLKKSQTPGSNIWSRRDPDLKSFLSHIFL